MGNLLDIIDKLDIKYIDSFAKELSLTGCTGGKKGFRTSGSSGELQAAKRIEREMIDIGLENVSAEEFPVDSWGLLDGSLVISGVDMKFEVSAYAGSAGTPPEGINGRILDVGKGRACDYEGLDAEGSIVLCTMDPAEDFWVSVPADQAKARGAAGILISYAGSRYSSNEDAVGCFDIQGSSAFPVANISRKTASSLRSHLKSSPGEITGTLTLDIDMEIGGGMSRNVIGYIPGELPDRYIMLGAHMDGFFNSYQDDVIGIGVHMSIAKAIISSGIKPRHTIIIVAHGSEEYGAADSRYDWCIGSYHAVYKMHPEWFSRIDVFLNFDALRPDAPQLVINATPEYGTFLGEFASKLRLPEGCWPEGAAVAGLHGPWSDDYNYAVNGIPSLICGKGPSQWSSMNYHTQFDNYTVFKTERRIVSYIAELYTRYIDLFDGLDLPPLDFSPVFRDLTGSLGAAEKFCVDETEALRHISSEAEACAGKVYGTISGLNGEQHDGAQYDALRGVLFDTYRIVQRDLYRLDVGDSVVFAHEPVAAACSNLVEAGAAIKARDAVRALDALGKVDLNMYAIDFDDEVYELMAGRIDPDNDKLFWGKDNLHRLYDGRRLIGMIRSARTGSDFENLEKEITHALDMEISQLREVLGYEQGLMEHICGDLAVICGA